ncbi:Endothelin-converting enzyme 2-like protein, partial [Leptotrombidium deliense]
MSKTGGDDNEPKENDKCITPPTTGTGAGDNGVGHAVEPEFTKKTKRNAFLESVDSAKNVINERYKLIIAILSVLIFILLLIVIVLAVSLGSATKAQDICVTSACLRAASNIVRSLNTSADPCNNFWSFSCG